MTAVETIREAATLMKEQATRAQSAVGDEPWHFVSLGWGEAHGTTYTVESTAGAHIAEGVTEEVAEHIASWSPTVALAVADMLDLAATHEERSGDDCGQGYVGSGYGYVDPSCSVCGTPDEYAEPWPCETVKRALTAALTYLGQAS